jgi:hypothetical protein
MHHFKNATNGRTVYYEIHGDNVKSKTTGRGINSVIVSGNAGYSKT